MITALDTIDLLPGELAAALESDPFFADIPVVVVEKGNVLSEVAKRTAVITAKGGKRGVSVFVLQVIGDDEMPNVNFSPMTLRPAFQVVENVELNTDANGTGKSARRVARKIRDVIKALRLVGLTTDFVPDRPAIEPITLAKELSENVVVYQVNFLTYEADSEAISQCEMPQIAAFEADTPQIQLTCGTEGAQIWYTTDDSFPTPTDRAGNSTAQLYGTPIDVPVVGFIIRCMAVKEGLIGSPVNRAHVDYTS
jgi:hypothetical protein